MPQCRCAPIKHFRTCDMRCFCCQILTYGTRPNAQQGRYVSSTDVVAGKRLMMYTSLAISFGFCIFLEIGDDNHCGLWETTLDNVVVKRSFPMPVHYTAVPSRM